MVGRAVGDSSGAAIVVVVVGVFGIGVMPGCRSRTIATMPVGSAPQPKVSSASTRGVAQKRSREAETEPTCQGFASVDRNG